MVLTEMGDKTEKSSLEILLINPEIYIHSPFIASSNEVDEDVEHSFKGTIEYNEIKYDLTEVK